MNTLYCLALTIPAELGLFISPVAAGVLSWGMNHKKVRIRKRLSRIPKPARTWILRGLHAGGTALIMAGAQKVGLAGDELSMAFAMGIGLAASGGVQVSYGVGKNGNDK